MIRKRIKFIMIPLSGMKGQKNGICYLFKQYPP